MFCKKEQPPLVEEAGAGMLCPGIHPEGLALDAARIPANKMGHKGGAVSGDGKRAAHLRGLSGGGLDRVVYTLLLINNMNMKEIDINSTSIVYNYSSFLVPSGITRPRKLGDISERKECPRGNFLEGTSDIGDKHWSRRLSERNLGVSCCVVVLLWMRCGIVAGGCMRGLEWRFGCWLVWCCWIEGARSVPFIVHFYS